MKRLLLVIIVTIVISCQTSDDGNPILPNVPVNETVFLNNPSSLPLQSPGGSIAINGGISGIFVYNLNNNQYFAYDRACPHLTLQQCSTPMVINDGLNMECNCDGTKFALALGGAPQSGTQYSAREYKVVKNGDTLLITNF